MNIGVYLVTDPVLCGTRGVVETVRAAVDAGVQMVQIRDKITPDGQLLELIAQVADITQGKATLLINDHLELAVRSRKQGIAVDGVHLGQSDASVHTARELLGADAIIGLSASTQEHVRQLGPNPQELVDYLGVGAIRATTTKPDYEYALGIQGFADLVQATSIPAVAIGGIATDDVADLRRVGAAGIAVVSAICAAEDPGSAAAKLVQAWNSP